MKAENKPRLELAHDQNKILLYSDNDMVELDAAEADEFVKELAQHILRMHDRIPPAPAPISYESMGHGKSNKGSFAEVGEGRLSDGFEGSVYIGGYELTLDGAKELKTWLDKAIKYMEE